MLKAGLQSILRLVYPPQCLTCGVLVDSDHGLCGPCWRDTPFITSLTCDLCGQPLPGEPGEEAHCDDCLRIARPWCKGRSVFRYAANGRRLILGLKHGDRLDYGAPAARWMAQRARPMVEDQPALVVPIPMHWRRQVRRRYNQAAILAQGLAQALDRPAALDLLLRPQATMEHKNMTSRQRFRNMEGAFRVNPRRKGKARGATILLVDDVMTSGATLAAGTEACLAAGAGQVFVQTLARAAKMP